MDIVSGIIENAEKLSIAGALALLAAENAYLLWAVSRKKLVPGWAYTAKENECDGWRDIALTAVPALKEVVTKK